MRYTGGIITSSEHIHVHFVTASFVYRGEYFFPFPATFSSAYWRVIRRSSRDKSVVGNVSGVRSVRWLETVETVQGRRPERKKTKPTAEFAARLPRRVSRLIGGLSSRFFAQLSDKWHAGQTFTLTRFLERFLDALPRRCPVPVRPTLSCEKRDSFKCLRPYDLTESISRLSSRQNDTYTRAMWSLECFSARLNLQVSAIRGTYRTLF